MRPKNFPMAKKLCLFFLALSSFAMAQGPGNAPKSWTVDPFEHRVFIENRGQFNGGDELKNSTIYYGVENMGVKIYFTQKGLTWRYDRPEIRKESERKFKDGIEEEDGHEEEGEVLTDLIHLEWLGSNPNASVIAENSVSQYYNYSAGKDYSKDINFVKAYTRLLYKDIYPGIDLEYTFSEQNGKKGMKYVLFVKPGADASKIRMRYSGSKGISIDNKGNIHVGTVLGDIIDHAPVSFYHGSNIPVTSAFEISGKEVAIKLGAYDNKQALIIDPFTVNPNFTSQNKAMDVEHDAAGNVYVFGGWQPYKLMKYTPGGTLTWTLNTPYTGNYYGDLSVTNNGVAYITAGHNGCGSLPSISKVTPAGAIVWNNTIGSCMEFWCISSNCPGTSIVSGDSFSPPGGRLSNIDTTNGNRVGSVQVTTGGKDFRAMCLAPNGNFYVLTTDYSPPHNLVGLTPAFTTIFNVTSGHTSGYGGTPAWSNGNIAGFNGITANCRYIYHFDGLTVWKRNINTGAQISTVASVPSGSKDACQGVAVDGCGNVFIGTTNSVLKYDSTLTLLTTTATTGVVYDVTMGLNGEVLASGFGFLSSLAISTTNCQSVNINTTNASCSNPGTATVVLGATACAGAYTYSWTPGGQTTQTVTGLTAGTYTVNIKTPNGCGVNNTNYTFTITGGGGASLTLNTSQTNASCQTLGSASVTATGGTGALTYSWNPTGQNTQNATGLSAGTYTVTVTDNTGCSGTKSVAITNNGGGLTAGISTSGNVNCNGGNNGTASITASGGTSPYTYTWNNTQNTANATNLSAGTYTVTVTDANGCTQTATVTITQPTALTSGISASANPNCNGANNGSATVTAGGGTTGYTYLWSNAQNTAAITGLTAGTYSVLITDNKGCTSTASVTLTQPTALAINTSSTIANCGQSNGTAGVTASGGTGSFTYLWSAGAQATATATGLSAGTYTITVTDANNCSTSKTVAVNSTNALSASVTATTNVSCFGGNDGTASATVTSGSGTFTYAWSPNGGTGSTGTGLSAGNYTVTITDNNGCTGTASTLVTEPSQLTLGVTGNAVCGGQAATLTSTAGGGTTGYTYSWSNGQLTASATSNSAGTYTLTVTDNKGCTATATAVVTVNSAPVITLTANDTAGCAPLCVNFSCTTANINSWSWDFGDAGSGSSNTSTLQNPSHCFKSPGAFTVTLTVTDNNGCTATLTKTAWINVYPNTVADFSASPQPTTVLNPNITFTDMSTGANTWSWNFGESSSGSSNTSSLQNPVHTYKDSGCYNVQLIADNQYNCPDTAEKVICINGDYELFAPNAFTPDGSGLNDVWNVKGIGIDPSHFKLWIFDRWGNLIFETSDLYQGWNGKANGGKEIAQQDVYVWKVATRDFLGGKHSYIGHVSLVR